MDLCTCYKNSFEWLLHYCALLDGWLDEVITLLQLPLSPSLATGTRGRGIVSVLREAMLKCQAHRISRTPLLYRPPVCLESSTQCCNSEIGMEPGCYGLLWGAINAIHAMAVIFSCISAPCNQLLSGSQWQTL